MWHARVSWGTDEYGRWIPTGCTNIEDAQWYVKTYQSRDIVTKLFVKEWLFI